MVVKIEREQSCHPSLLCAARNFGVGHQSAVILALEAHVHDIVFLLYILSQHLALVCLFVVDL